MERILARLPRQEAATLLTLVKMAHGKIAGLVAGEILKVVPGSSLANALLKSSQ